MSDKEFVDKLSQHLKGHARMFTPGNNWVLGPTNRTAEGIAEWVVEFLKQEDIKF